MKFTPITVVLDENERILAVNPHFLELTGYSIEEIRGRKFSDFILSKAKEGESILKTDSKQIDIVLRKRDNTSLFAQLNIYRPYVGPKRLLILRGYDITELRHLEKLCKILFAINSIIIHSKSVREILERICQVLVDDLGLRMAWVGEIRDGEVRPIYWYGHEEGYLSKIKIVLDPTRPEGCGPTAEALRSGLISINPDSRTNPKYEAFREEALKRGYLSSVAIPVVVEGQLKTVLNLYSTEPNFFNERIQPLLEEIKKNLEYAIEKLEKEKFVKIISTALMNSDLLVIVTDRKGLVQYLNTQVELLFGLNVEDLLGKPITTLAKGFDEISGFTEISKILQSEEGFSGIVQLRKRDGEPLYLDLKVIPLNILDEESLVWVGRDLTMEIGLLETIESLRNFDSVTKALTLRSAISKAREVFPYITTIAIVVVIDLYQFTYINETFGISAGDQLLIECTQRLREIIGERNLLARVASDEFLIYAFDFPSNASVAFFIESLKRVFREPFRVNGREILLKYNMGIAIYPQDGTDPEDLHKKASTACAFAKREGPNVLKFFETKLESLIQKTLQIENLIKEAFEKGYFQFYFQPYFFSKTLSVSGAEALVRIRKPDGEVIPPSVFIETLENSPYRKDFELWALRAVVEKINTFKLPIGLNLYPKTFQDEHFWLTAEPQLSQLRYPLILEITERGFIENPERTIRIISALKTRLPHIKLALDDFGTGYSNLGYLKQLPLDVVKIDILFVRDIVEGAKERGIVKTIIDLAHILGAKALAEGVETREHFEILDIMGCDFVQGYYFDKPLPEEEFIKKYLPNLCSRSPQSETQS